MNSTSATDPFVAMCITRDNRCVPKTVVCMSKIAEYLGRPFVWSDFSGIGITIYLNLGVRATAKALHRKKFYAFMLTDDVLIEPSMAPRLSTEIEMAEERRYDFMLPVPTLLDRKTNITTTRGDALTLDQVRALPPYSVYGRDFKGGACIAAYYGEFDADYTFHEDDEGRDESYYFITEQKKQPRLIPDIPVGHYKSVFLV